MAFKSCTSSPEMFDGWLAAPPRSEVLERLATLIDRDALREAVAPAYKDLGRIGFDPVLLIKLLVLQRLYQLSDPGVVAEAADRLSFRKFLDLGAGAQVPDDTTLVKFRGRLRNYGVFDKVIEAFQTQLELQGIKVKEGSIKLVDATLVAAAVRPPAQPKEGEAAPEPLDPDATFTVKKGKAVYGYKLHMAQDRETGLVTGHVVTPAHVHDSQVFEEFLDQGESEAMADKAYDSKEHRKMCRALGVKCSVMKRATQGRELSRWWKGRNKSIGRVRGFIEGTFAHLKRYLGCGRAIYRGLTRVGEQLAWGIVAFNLKRATALAPGRQTQPARGRKTQPVATPRGTCA